MHRTPVPFPWKNGNVRSMQVLETLDVLVASLEMAELVIVLLASIDGS